MNLRTYKILHHKIDWKHAFADLKWGIILPVLAYVAILFQPVWYIKAGCTLLLIGVVAILVIKDNYLKELLLGILYKIKRKNNAG